MRKLFVYKMWETGSRELIALDELRYVCFEEKNPIHYVHRETGSTVFKGDFNEEELVALFRVVVHWKKLAKQDYLLLSQEQIAEFFMACEQYSAGQR